MEKSLLLASMIIVTSTTFGMIGDNLGNKRSFPSESPEVRQHVKKVRVLHKTEALNNSFPIQNIQNVQDHKSATKLARYAYSLILDRETKYHKRRITNKLKETGIGRNIEKEIIKEIDGIEKLGETVEGYEQKGMPRQLVEVLSEYARKEAVSGALERISNLITRKAKVAQFDRDYDSAEIDRAKLRLKNESIDNFLKNLSKEQKSLFEKIGISIKDLKLIMGGFYSFAHDLPINPGSGRPRGSLNKKTLERLAKEKSDSELKKSKPKIRQSERFLKGEQTEEILKKTSTKQQKRKRGRPKGSHKKS